MRPSRPGLSSIYGFIVIFTLLMAGIGASLTIMDSQAAVWNAQDRARQVQSGQQAEHLSLSLNGTSLTVRNDGLIPSSLAYLYQKGASTSTDARIGSSLQEGSKLKIPVTSGMLSFAVITSLGNVFWVNNSTLSVSQSTTLPVTFDAYGLDPSFSSATILSVDGIAYSYSSMPKTFAWTPGSLHSYSYAQGFATAAGQRVGWSYARGLSSAMAGTVTASQPGSIVSTYALQYLLTVTSGNAVQYIGSPAGDGWYNAGTNAQISTNYAWNLLAEQSRQSLVSYSLDGSTPIGLPRSGSGTYMTPSVTMNSPHSLVFNSVTQYSVTVTDSVPSSGVTNALAVSYSYTPPPSSFTGPSSLSTDGHCANSANVSPAAPSGTNSITMTIAVLVSGTPGDTLTIGGFEAGNCYYPFTVNYTPGSSGTYTASTSVGPLPSSASYYVYYSTGGGCPNPDPPPSRTYCGTVFTITSVSGTFAVGGLTSGSTSSGPNTFSVSGTTVTYAYGVGYNFPIGSASTTWSATWPSTETYSSDNCTGGSHSGNTISGSGGTCTLITTALGSYAVTFSGSQTGDGWYDSGSSVAIGASASGRFAFSSWSSSNGGVLTIASPGSMLTTVLVATYGTVTANFNVIQ